MEIQYVSVRGYSVVDSDKFIKQHIEAYHNYPQGRHSANMYECLRADCVNIYQACEEKSHNCFMTKTSLRQLANFMSFFYDEFEEILSETFKRPIADFNDEINYTAPEYCGLYLVGDTHFNPITHEEFYWVKIGKATNIKKRLNDYNTYCPMLFRIDFKKSFSDRIAYQEEADYQRKLKAVALATNNHNKEWFLVDRNTYLEICANGFAYFD